MNNHSLSKAIRYKEWYDSKLSCFFLVFIFYVLKNRSSFDYSILADLGVVMIFGFSLLAFGYAYNDFCDKKQDQIAGKQNTISQYGLKSQITILLFLVTVGMTLPSFYFKSKGQIISVLISFFLAFLYSNRLTKIKERKYLGLLISSIAQRVSPLFLIFFVFDDFSLTAIAFVLLSFFIGIRWILIHQHHDIENDIKSGTRTFVSQQDNKNKVLKITTIIFFCELLLLLLIFTINIKAFQAYNIFILLIYSLFQLNLFSFWRKVGWKRMILSYDFAPLADLYYLWLPFFVTINLLAIDIKYILLLMVVIYFGYRYIQLDLEYYKLKIRFR